jgi:hypothetical protein
MELTNELETKGQMGNTQSVKEELITNIKEWIKMDNEIANLKSEIKQKNNRKTELTETLVKIMKNNSIDCFDINGGALVYKKKKTKRVISGKFLLQQLEEYYGNDIELAKDITKKILDNRVELLKEKIERKISKVVKEKKED